jgi:hypothetical protein
VKPIERLIARVVQLVEDNPAQVVTITITVDDKGQPYCWVVTQQRAEGLQRREE